MAPAGSEGCKEEDFVLLDKSEAVSAQLQDDSLARGGSARVVEYELASFRRTLSSITDDASYARRGNEDFETEGNEEDTDDLSLEDMPEDLRGLCRRLRAQSRALDAEERRETGTVLGEGGSGLKDNEGVGDWGQGESRRRRQQVRRRHPQAEACLFEALWRFSWPLGTRDILIGALLVVFMTTLISLSGGRHTRAVPLAANRRGSEGERSAPPLYVFDDVASAVATAAAFPGHCASWAFQSARSHAHEKASSPPLPVKISLLEGRVRALVSMVGDLEKEVAWRKALQEGLEREVEGWEKKARNLEAELRLARESMEGGREGGREGAGRDERVRLTVVPEVHTIKEGGDEEERAETRAPERAYWWGSEVLNWGSDNSLPRGLTTGLKEGGREGGREGGGAAVPSPDICPCDVWEMSMCTDEGDWEVEEWEWWSEDDEEWWSEDEEEEEEEDGMEEGVAGLECPLPESYLWAKAEVAGRT